MASSLAVQKFEGQSIAPFSGGSPALGYTGGGGSAGKPLIGGKPEGVLDEMVSFFDKIDAGILKLVDFASESLGFDKKADEINKEQSASINKMADVMADDLDLEKIQTNLETEQTDLANQDLNLAEEDLKGEQDARTISERMAAEAARGEGLEEQDVPRRGMLDTLKAGAGKVRAGFGKAADAYANMGDKMKVALFATIAVGLATAAGKLNKVITPALKLINEKIVPAFKEGMSVIIDDIGPVFDRVIAGLSGLFSGLVTFAQGIFEFDIDKINEGLKKIVLEFLPNAISAFGTMIFSAVEGLLTFLGVDPDGVVMKSVRFIKKSFLMFPENLANMISGITNFVVEKFDIAKNFITETIPQFFTDMKNSIIQGIKNMISFIVDPIVELKDNIAEGIDTGVEKIKSNIVGIINKIKDVFAGFVNNLKGMANSVIDLVNKVPGIKFKKFEITPLSTDEPEFAAMDTAGTGDAQIAERIAAEKRATTEGDLKRQEHNIGAWMGSEKTYSGYYNNPYDELHYDKNIAQQGADEALFGKEYVDSLIEKSLINQAKLEELLKNTLQNQELKADAETSEPIVVANTTTGGDVVNQTSVHSAEPASDHQDSTAKHLANAMV